MSVFLNLCVLLQTYAAPAATACAARFDKCGGEDYTGPTCCTGTDMCTIKNKYYSQCTKYMSS